VIVLILFLGLALRLINLNQSLWLDESIELLAVKSYSYLDLATKYVLGDFHPPLYHLVLKFWTGIFGNQEIAGRFPSVLFGVFTIYFVYLIGKKLVNQKVAAVAAFFLAISPLAIYYSQEARMYSFAAMLVAGAVWFLLKKNWAWFLLFVTASLYTDYLPFLMIPVYFFIAPDRKKAFIALFFSFILFVPWLPYLLAQLRIATSIASAAPLWGVVVGGFTWKALPLTLVKFIIGRIPSVFVIPAIWLYLFLLARARKLSLWLWLLIPLGIGFVLSLRLSVFSYFRFLFTLPAFVLLLAVGARNKTSVAAVAVISLLALAVFNLNPSYQREDWRGLAAYLKTDPGLVVFPNLAQSDPIKYYYPTADLADINGLNVRSYERIYLIRYVQEIFDPQDLERTTVEKLGYKRVAEKAFNGVMVWKYQQ
jgi:mannosyltransferase